MKASDKTLFIARNAITFVAGESIVCDEIWPSGFGIGSLKIEA